MSHSEISNLPYMNHMMNNRQQLKPYPTSVTELSAILIHAQRDTLNERAVNLDTPPREAEGCVGVCENPGVALKKAHTCGSLFAKCNCNNNVQCTPPLSIPKSSSISTPFAANKDTDSRVVPKRLSNPETSEETKKPNRKCHKPYKAESLQHPDIPYPIEREKVRSISFSQQDKPDISKKSIQANLNYHKYTALAYGSPDSSDQARKFLEDFGIFGPMGNGIAPLRKNSKVSSTELDQDVKRGSKVMCLENQQRKKSPESAANGQHCCENFRNAVSRLERELSDTRIELQQVRSTMQAKESEVLKLQRENHKLKSVLQQTTKGIYKDGDLLTSLQEQHAMANRVPQIHQSLPNCAILKKQGVSAESSETHNQPCDISIVKHDKDFRSKQLIKNAILENDFLKHLNSSQVRELVDSMYSREFQAGTYVIREGEAGAHLFVSASGDFEVVKDKKVLGRMGPGKAFGELAILYNCTRTASIRALVDSKVWMLDRKVFQQIMVRTGMQRLQDNVNFLRSVPLLQNLSNEVLAKIADVLEVEMYPAGTYIIRQGATGDTFFIISSGKVKITQRIPGVVEEQEIRTLDRGDYFGEQALLKEDFRTASVIALHPGVECLTLDRDSFIQLIGDLSEIKEKDYGDEQRVLNRPLCHGFKNEFEYEYIKLDDLDVMATLGIGGFGRVELVQYCRDPSLTFALKCLKKQHIVDTQQQEHIFSEKQIMLSCRSPFICRLYRTYRDSKCVYMLLEACLGGEVWTILRDRGCFDDHTTRFITACVVEAFEYLHVRGIIYRDLKPENLLLDAKGYVKIVDFGFSKCMGYSSKTWTFCGTPEYVAPETILNKGHDRAVDYWALGILMHELLSGNPPFTASDPMKTYNLILKGIDMIDFGIHNISRSAQSLIKKLCRDAPSERLGYQRGGIQDIKKHKWFQCFDWAGLSSQTLAAPIIQPVRGPCDTTNFDCFIKDNDIPPDELSGWDVDF
ncbi:cGMP-dependent protein kinase, isozyme 1 [Onthophagus taurus]|uniref:cGMP-dependent protein kinase, isozyme 1 n=1 Tax=Onthophagus taurus TaxID=166361 RepID=UPI000C202DAD|nr:cGMP-dependent protein kinase, isozyme 1 [Onthophagus taurus]